MSYAKYNIEQRVWLVTQKIRLVHNISVIRLWKREFNSAPPNYKTIDSLIKRFNETGSVADLPRSGRPVTAVTTEATKRVSDLYEDRPSTSSRRASNELGVSRTSVRRIIKSLNLRVYVPRLVQSLHEDDFDRRLEFCEEMLRNFENNPDLIDKIVWSDEAKFRLDGQVNRHNCVYYATENPHLIHTKEVASPGITVWAGIHSSGIVGPFFFHETVTGAGYLDMLKSQFFPVFKALGENYVLQQDGAPPHFARDVRQWLDENLDGGWIGRRGSFCDWPPRSPDLTVCDFFLWGYLKDRIYASRCNNLMELEQRIRDEFVSLNLEFCERACRSVPQRLHDCIQAEGHQFEHLR